jgi:hypothetical protein
MNKTRKCDHLSSFDLMIIRAGGRTENEKQQMSNGIGFSRQTSALCSHLANMAYPIVSLLEAGAKRSIETSHLRSAKKHNMGERA